MKIVVWNDGSYRFFINEPTWEYENDEDWLVTINIHKEYWKEIDERWTHKPTFSKDIKGSLVKGTKNPLLTPLFPDGAKTEDYIPEGVKYYNKLKDKK